MAMHRIIMFAAGLVACLLFTHQAMAQQQPSSTTQVAPAETLLKNEELDALVAPIALYPDNLLSLVLMASTYPIEIVQADRFVKENSKLKGEQLKGPVDKQPWDDSVKSLTATPDVLSMMSTKLDWMTKLGNAVLSQQPDVMDAIQRLRNKADNNNKLVTTKEQKVVKRQESGKQVIAIEPADPEVLYVPYYDPAVVYGAWPYAEYPPYYFEWPGYIPGSLIAAGLAFGTGWALGNWGSSGNWWGGDFNWNNGNINIDRPRVNPLDGKNWQHNPAHRHGVKYDNPRVAQRFGNNNLAGSRQDRMDFRGRDGNQVIRPDGARPGQLPTKGDRPSAGQLPAGKGSAKGPGDAGKGAAKGKGPSGGNKAAQRPSGGGKKAAQRPSGGSKKAAQRPGGQRPSAAQRPRAPANAMGNINRGRAANFAGARGHASLGGGRSFAGGGRNFGGGGRSFGGGGRGGGGFGGGGRGGGGRRSDISFKHDVVLLGRLANGLGFYRFSYTGQQRRYVGVIAQEVETVMPSAVIRDRDGYLRVLYEKLGLQFQTYERWLMSGGHVPIVSK